MKTRSFFLSLIATSALFTSLSCAAYEKGQLILRTGPAHVNPDDSSGPLRLAGNEIAGTSAQVGDDTQLGITLTYMLRDNLGVSLLASTPFEHQITEVGVGIKQVGSAKHLPPTLTLQYYPDFGSKVFQPYIGAGLNYTKFFDEEASGALNTALGNASMSLDDSLGVAFEIGADFSITEQWSINASLWLADIDTEATITSDAGLVEVDVDIDPAVYMLGVSYNF